jgi:hypothetical protein
MEPDKKSVSQHFHIVLLEKGGGGELEGGGRKARKKRKSISKRFNSLHIFKMKRVEREAGSHSSINHTNFHISVHTCTFSLNFDFLVTYYSTACDTLLAYCWLYIDPIYKEKISATLFSGEYEKEREIKTLKMVRAAS